MNREKHSGFITIIGKPNVGKSTLINRFCGQKLSITSRKPQTTRHRITAIKTSENYQYIFIDTPGLHRNPKHKLNKLMIKSALSAMHDVDVLLFMTNAKNLDDDDKLILQRLAKARMKPVIVLNKVDQLTNKKSLLVYMKEVESFCADIQLDFHAIIPISAKLNDGISELEQKIKEFIPKSPFMYPNDQKTDRSQRFIAAELIREKLMRFLGEEVPHCTTVEIEKFKLEQNKKKVLHIHALIWVEREGQKKIIIGNKGEHLKNIATIARGDLEEYFQEKVFLQLWVKVKKGWLDDSNALNYLGYDES